MPQAQPRSREAASDTQSPVETITNPVFGGTLNSNSARALWDGLGSLADAPAGTARSETIIPAT